jgi:hypothetical protein
VAWLRTTAAARKRKLADEANSKKQVRRERGQSIFAVQPKPMMAAGQIAHPMAVSMGAAYNAMPAAANVGMAPGMAMPAASVMPPHGKCQWLHWLPAVGDSLAAIVPCCISYRSPLVSFVHL